jgi:hypothetical protein
MRSPKSRALFAVLVLPLAVAAVACRGPSTKQTLTRARSDMTASAFALERYAAGDSTGVFTRASIDQYASALEKSGRQLRSTPPPEDRDARDASVAAIADAQSALRTVAGDLTPDRARDAAARLRADAAKLPRT